MIFGSKKYLTFSSKKYLWIKELSSGKSLIFRSKKYFICRLKNYMQIDELEIEEVFDLQTEGIFADGRTKCRSKNYLQIEETFASQRIICKPKNYSIGRLKNDMQIKKLSTDWQTVCWLNNFLHIKFQFVDTQPAREIPEMSPEGPLKFLMPRTCRGPSGDSQENNTKTEDLMKNFFFLKQ